MAGSIRPRPDKGSDAWELRVFLGRDAAGRVRHKSRLFHGTRRAADRELAHLLAQQDEIPEVVPDQAARPWGPSTSFNDAIAGWRDNGWQDLSPLTAARYESVWRLHIEHGIGRQRIVSTGPYDVERYFRKLKKEGAGREGHMSHAVSRPGVPTCPQMEREHAAEPSNRHGAPVLVGG